MARPTVDFVSLAREEAPAAPVQAAAPVQPMEKVQPVAEPVMAQPSAQQQTIVFPTSQTQRTHVIQAIEDAPVQETARMSAPQFSSSFHSSAFDARQAAVEEDFSAANAQTLVMPKMNARPTPTMATPKAAEESVSAEESLYGVPAFLGNNRISEDEF
jgi:hypothetical protein